MANHSSATTREQTPHTIIDTLSQTTTGGPGKEKIEALAEIICGAGDEAAAALLVLMGTIQNSEHPKALVNAAKHFAFTRCGELNVFGMVDAQVATVEGELLLDQAKK